MDKFGLAVVVFLGFIVLAALLSLLSAVPVFFLWNWLMPAIFGLKIITFWQAWGLCWLFGLLFKSTSTTTTKES